VALESLLRTNVSAAQSNLGAIPSTRHHQFTYSSHRHRISQASRPSPTACPVPHLPRYSAAVHGPGATQIQSRCTGCHQDQFPECLGASVDLAEAAGYLNILFVQCSPGGIPALGGRRMMPLCYKTAVIVKDELRASEFSGEEHNEPEHVTDP